MKKVQIIATAAALAVGGFLALESVAQSNFSLTVGEGRMGPGPGAAGAELTFDQNSTAWEMSCALASQVDPRFGCP